MHVAKIALLGIASILVSRAGSAPDPTVVLGGAGPSPYLEQALDKIADALTSDGVKVKILSGDARTRTALLEEARHRELSNLLYVTLENPRQNPADSSRGDVVGTCFVDGKKVWEENSKGPLMLPMGKDHEIDSMVNGIVKKISKRAGGPCLPK